MANWSGTHTITAGAAGTSTGGNTSTTFNAAATWPTGANTLVNFTLRILTGLGAGQERVVASNTATVITISSAWTTIPDATSTYEVVLIFKNGDHFSATTTLSTNIRTELEDSATIYFDGLYTLTCTTSCTVRWGKTLQTMVTFEPNNKLVQGVQGFWNSVDFATTLTIIPTAKYIKFIGGGSTFFCRSNAVGFTGSTVSHIWAQDCSTSLVSIGGHILLNNETLKNMFARGGRSATVIGATAASTFTHTFSKIWCENSPSGGGWTYTATGPNTQFLKDSVFKKSWANKNINIGAAITATIQDSYVSSFAESSVIVMGHLSTAAGLGTYRARRNDLDCARAIYGAAGVGTATITSSFNDIAPSVTSALRAIEIASATSYATATSDNDFIAGSLLALPENVDTSAATTSGASPSQYNNLTAARTNPKSVRNRKYELDNVVNSILGIFSATFTFDCVNGAVSGQGSTTVNVDSSSGAAVLNVASTTGFEVGEIIEVGYGTARFEEVEILSIGIGTITATTNLTFTHTAAQADTVKKQLRHKALPFIRYGIVSGVYDSQTQVPDESDWGLIFTEINQTYLGKTFEFKRYGHTVTLEKLKAGTTYFAKAYAYDPLGYTLESSEFSFTTNPDSGGGGGGGGSIGSINLGSFG